MKGDIMRIWYLSLFASPLWRVFFVLMVFASLLRQDVRVPASKTASPARTALSGSALTRQASSAAVSAAQARVTGGNSPARRISQQDSARFLAQATFGPTLEDIERVRQLGYAGWIEEQVAHPMSSQLRFLRAAGSTSDPEWRLDAWFTHALGGRDPFDPNMIHRDQLRQRVAFALSEIFVVSDATSDSLGGAPQGMTDYYDTLARGAFGNFRDLLENVTLHPVMGVYLSMLGNEKPDAANNIRPDENYAREVLQLFSVGTVMLGPDGVPLDGNRDGRPDPSYGQDTVKGFAHVFTGWSFSDCPWGFRGCYAYDKTNPAWVRPMMSYPQYHASAQTKQLLVYSGSALPGGVLAAGGTPESNLDAALDNIFHHPNVGPFIGKQLIQRLVTSNPSPAYVQRVAQVFNNNGSGVRGDMKAVVRAILLDDEARQAVPPANFGKVREPLLRLTHLLRATDASAGNGHMEEFWTLSSDLGQMPMSAPSVFNFFSPRYMPPGLLANAGLVAPELQLATDYLLPSHEAYFFRRAVDHTVEGPPHATGTFAVNVGRDLPLAADAPALVARYNLLFLSGRMSPKMQNTLVAHLQAIPGSTVDGRRERVRNALYLIVNSPEYVVQK